MNMWLFETPKNYPDMLKKIAWTMFFIVLIGLFIVAQYDQKFSDFMKSTAFNLTYEKDGLKLSISYIYIPLLFALLENIFKLHDKISDIFFIRYRFDKFVIINEYLKSLQMPDKIKKVNKKNRDNIMIEIFYKYAGYASPVIDSHLVYMALGNWSWYWIIIDTLIVSIVLGGLMLYLEYSHLKLLLILGLLLSLYLISIIIKNIQCKKSAISEVKAILANTKRKKESARYLNNEL